MAPVWLLLIVSIISLTAVASADPNSTVSGLVGGSLTIDCPYSSRTDLWKQKVWCKELRTGQCEKIIWTRRFYLPFVRRNSGNTFITDYIREHRVSVTINYLRREDTGVYRCQTHAGDEIHTLRAVKVEVLEDLDEMPGAEESRTDSKSHSSLLVMTPGLVTAIFAVILLSKVLVVLAVYMMVRRRAAMTEAKAQEKKREEFCEPAPGRRSPTLGAAALPPSALHEPVSSHFLHRAIPNTGIKMPPRTTAQRTPDIGGY